MSNIGKMKIYSQYFVIILMFSFDVENLIAEVGVVFLFSTDNIVECNFRIEVD